MDAFAGVILPFPNGKAKIKQADLVKETVPNVTSF